MAGPPTTRRRKKDKDLPVSQEEGASISEQAAVETNTSPAESTEKPPAHANKDKRVIMSDDKGTSQKASEELATAPKESEQLATSREANVSYFLSPTDFPPKAEDCSVVLGYDESFLEYSDFTTLNDLMADNERTLDEDIEDSFKPDTKATFLWALLLKIAPPSAASQEANQYLPFGKGTNRPMAKRQKSAPVPYKKALTFADLMDPQRRTFNILEMNNNTHNTLFANKSMDQVKVGELFAIKSPVVTGKLKSGSFVVQTARPVEVLQKPYLPTKPLDASRAANEMQYFVMHEQKVYWKKKQSADAMKTLCNGTACDRLQLAATPNLPCGCWGQAMRNDSGSKNTVIKMSFLFQDVHGRKHMVDDFTSLSFSKLLFKNNEILATENELNRNTVWFILQQTWKKVLSHVNENGGWTIVGWYKRGTQAEDELQDNEEAIVKETVKINVCRLAPSTSKGAAIPDEILLNQAAIRAAMDAK